LAIYILLYKEIFINKQEPGVFEGIFNRSGPSEVCFSLEQVKSATFVQQVILKQSATRFSFCLKSCRVNKTRIAA
jgi:hypothetical protein